jgi:hypothetical protein
MADFSNLKALAVTNESTAEYSFPFIPGSPSIILAPAHDSNEAFLNERLRLSLERTEKATDGPRKQHGKVTAEDLKAGLQEDRELDRVLIAHTCARSWGTPPKDVNGDEPEFSAQNCYDFLKALPDYMFDPLRNFAVNIFNFVKRPTVTAEEADEMGNGSATD